MQTCALFPPKAGTDTGPLVTHQSASPITRHCHNIRSLYCLLWIALRSTIDDDRSLARSLATLAAVILLVLSKRNTDFTVQGSNLGERNICVCDTFAAAVKLDTNEGRRAVKVGGVGHYDERRMYGKPTTDCTVSTVGGSDGRKGKWFIYIHHSKSN
ncbi:hypothetical protein J6590_022413 [Homalodisca vitripennis]|nr:hypothetical protein J6590_022413 [Homalodisca vitripennis]